MSDLRALIERVEGLTEACRETDLMIAQVVVPDVIVLRQRADDSGADPYTHWEYTGSIDAAVALCERLLPAVPTADHEKSEIRLQMGDFGANAYVSRDTFSSDHLYFGAGKTPAIALVLATLRAIEASKGGRDG